MNKLQKKLAIITGGCSGIGLETAKLFVSEGARVIILDCNKDEWKRVKNNIDPNVFYYYCDVASPNDLDKTYSLIQKNYGQIDIVIANAGIAPVSLLSEISEEHIDNIFNINVKGLFFTVQKALPLMKNGGAIILTSSVSAFTAVPGMSIYSASKAAIRSFARTWAQELKDRQIRVNCISPGLIKTPIFSKLGFTEQQFEGMKLHFLEKTPLGRIGLPDEVAKAILFLASDDSSYVTGINLCVDGGSGQI